MSTKKPAEKKPTNVENMKNDKSDKLTLSDGSVVKREGVFAVNDKGEVEKIGASDLIQHNHAAITCMSRTKDGAVKCETYLCHWDKDGRGNYIFTVATCKGMDDENKHDEKMKPQDFKLLGRGDFFHATHILANMWNAYATQFGIQSAFKLVRVELDYKTKQWFALVAPVTTVLA